MTTTLTISGMSCGHCVAAVRRALEQLDGVAVHDVEVGRAEVDVDASRVTRADLAAAIDEAGFTLEEGQGPTPSAAPGR